MMVTAEVVLVAVAMVVVVAAAPLPVAPAAVTSLAWLAMVVAQTELEWSSEEGEGRMEALLAVQLVVGRVCLAKSCSRMCSLAVAGLSRLAPDPRMPPARAGLTPLEMWHLQPEKHKA